jgi:cation-transporting ATPase I
MAAKGSTSARSAADLVLTEPDVSLLLDALVEGRAMWRRVRDGVAVLLGGNAGELLFTLLGTALGGRAPLGTRQFLVVNMFTDLLPSMALALAPTPSGADERRALLAAEPPSLGAPLLRDIGLRGTVTSLGALLAWLVARRTGPGRRASTVALAALVGAELGQTLLLGGRDPLVVATGLGSAAVLAGIIQVPGISQLFGCTPLGPLAWAIVLGCATAATVTSAVLPRLAPGLLIDHRLPVSELAIRRTPAAVAEDGSGALGASASNS